MSRCTQLNEYYVPLYSSQVFEYSPVFTWGPGVSDNDKCVSVT